MQGKEGGGGEGEVKGGEEGVGEGGAALPDGRNARVGRKVKCKVRCGRAGEGEGQGEKGGAGRCFLMAGSHIWDAVKCRIRHEGRGGVGLEGCMVGEGGCCLMAGSPKCVARSRSLVQGEEEWGAGVQRGRKSERGDAR